MKRKLALLAGIALLVAACNPYDDSALVERLDKQDADIAEIRKDVDQLQFDLLQINADIAGLRTLVEAVNKKVYIKSVDPVKDSAGKVIGYTLALTDGNRITIYHGEKGEQGDPGEPGAPGTPGAPGSPGEPGTTPQIGVKEHDGVYYWTLNGEWLTDENGQPVPATGTNGTDGTDGSDGKTPQIRINEETHNWEVSYDGEAWTVVGPATAPGGAGDAVFAGVKETKTAVVFTLADGTTLSIDKLVEFYIKVDDSKAYEVTEGATTEIPYTLVGVGSGESRVDALASGDWWAEAVAADKTSGVVKVTAGKAQQAKVFFYATNGKGVTDIRSLVFTGGVLTATVPVEEIPAAGGEINIPVVTNVDYTVAIEEEAQYWLTYVITKAGAVRNEALVLTAAENITPAARSAKVELKDAQGAVIQSFTVNQAPGTFTEPVFEDSSFKNFLFYGTPYLDWNEDGKLSASEAAKCTSLTITGTYSSLAGIESLYNLKSFTYTENSGAKLTSIDLSKNKMLESVNISKSYYATSVLESLDLTDLLALQTVQTGGVTALQTIKLGKAPALTSFNAWNTALETLDVTQAPELLTLSIYGTKLTDLDVKKNPKLESLNAGITTLTALDVSQNTALKSLNIDNAPVTEMDLSGLTELTSFSAAATKMEKINLANSPKLTSISVGSYGTGTSNDLKVVDMRKATKLSSVSLYSSVLEEVIVPKGTSTSSWNWTSTHMNPDTGAITTVTVTEVDVEGGEEPSEDYLAGITEPFVKKVILGKFDANGDGEIDADEAAKVTELDFSECGLEDGDLAGLEVFPIKKLNLDGNSLTAVDVLAYPAIEWLSVNDNKLTELSIGSSYTALNQPLHLEAARNRITKFTGPSYYAKVNYLDLSGNKLAGSFSMPYPQNLEYINLSGNELTGVTLTSASKVKEINVSNNKLTSVAFSGFSALQKVDVSHNQLSAYSFGSAQTALAEVNLAYNKFASLDITSIVKSAALKKIDLTGNDDFSLLIIGAGNTLPETLEIVGVEGYGVLNATNPTKELTYNRYSYISAYELGDGATEVDAKVNFATSVKAFKVPAGSTLTLTSSGNRKALRFFALGAGGTPTVTVSRTDGKKVYNHDDNQYCSANPYTTRANESAGKDATSLVIDGDGDSVLYFFGPTSGTSSGGLVDGDKVVLTVGGSAGESVVFVGVNLETYTTDDYGWM